MCMILYGERLDRVNKTLKWINEKQILIGNTVLKEQGLIGNTLIVRTLLQN